jgi:hypothetical protein
MESKVEQRRGREEQENEHVQATRCKDKKVNGPCPYGIEDSREKGRWIL